MTKLSDSFPSTLALTDPAEFSFSSPFCVYGRSHVVNLNNKRWNVSSWEFKTSFMSHMSKSTPKGYCL